MMRSYCNQFMTEAVVGIVVAAKSAAGFVVASHDIIGARQKFPLYGENYSSPMTDCAGRDAVGRPNAQNR